MEIIILLELRELDYIGCTWMLVSGNEHRTHSVTHSHEYVCSAKCGTLGHTIHWSELIHWAIFFLHRFSLSLTHFSSSILKIEWREMPPANGLRCSSVVVCAFGPMKIERNRWLDAKCGENFDNFIHFSWHFSGRTSFSAHDLRTNAEPFKFVSSHLLGFRYTAHENQTRWRFLRHAHLLAHQSLPCGLPAESTNPQLNSPNRTSNHKSTQNHTHTERWRWNTNL